MSGIVEESLVGCWLLKAGVLCWWKGGEGGRRDVNGACCCLRIGTGRHISVSGIVSHSKWCGCSAGLLLSWVWHIYRFLVWAYCLLVFLLLGANSFTAKRSSACVMSSGGWCLWAL